jgi:hypothetical protein
MQKVFYLYLIIGLMLLGAATGMGLVAASSLPHVVMAAGLAVAGSLVMVGGAFVLQRSQQDEAALRTMERRIFDLESELEARAGDRAPLDDEP